jgi:hypothetical protein
MIEPSEKYQDAEHHIIDRPWEWTIGALHYHVGLDGTEPYVDLDMHRNAEVRRLRFWSPQQFEIEEGFPCPTHGMIILNVKGRGLERCSVWVTDFEASMGRIRFWARDVIDRDKQ